MSARIAIDASLPVGQMLAESIDKIQEGRAQLARVLEILYAAIYPDDTAAVAAELGADPAKGQAIFDLVNAAKTHLDGAAIVALRELDQG